MHNNPTKYHKNEYTPKIRKFFKTDLKIYVERNANLCVH